MNRTALSLTIASLVLGSAVVTASSHREAPLITYTPKVDGTDLYMFRSYEAGREDYVTLLANYQPVQDPGGGPNFYFLDDSATYTINIDNNGDAIADIKFEIEVKNKFQNLKIPVDGSNVAVPLINIGPFGPAPEANDEVKNLIETYTVTMKKGSLTVDGRNPATGERKFRKPLDNIGEKSIPAYEEYADNHIHALGLRGCAGESKVFVGQREEGFAVAVGEIFDLINLNPIGPTSGRPNGLAGKNVTTIALEVPIACLTGSSPIIGAWTTASTPDKAKNPKASNDASTQHKREQRQQVSRLSAPLVNEVVIGLPDKDRFNASRPVNDAQFAKYVTKPTMPELIEILFPAVQAPNLFPRTDLVAAFLTGIEGLNKPENVVPAEMMRLNTSIDPLPAASQNTLGVIAGDTAGFPNGRRPGDDVVDIELRVLMGVLLPADVAPSGQLPFTDGVEVSAGQFRSTFPYLNTPLPGAKL